MTARFERIVKGLKVRSIFFLLVSLFLLAVCWERVAIIVGPGQGGVIWKLVFGGTRTTEGFLGEGLHLIFPWDRVFQYDLRMQKNISSYDVVTAFCIRHSARNTSIHCCRLLLPRAYATSSAVTR